MYRERLWPPPSWFLLSLLLIPAVILVLAPINLVLGIAVSIPMYGLAVLFLLSMSPTVTVSDEVLRAGRGRIERRYLGEATVITGAAVFPALHSELDARAWLCLRGWSRGIVTIPINDPDDPTPYWVISSKHPERLAAALNS